MPIITTAEKLRILENFGDCMKGRIRFMTAITPAYAHAYQVTCLTRHIPDVQNQRYRLLITKAIYAHLTNVPQRAKEAMIFRDGRSTLTGVPALADGETLAGWVLLHDLPMEE